MLEAKEWEAAMVSCEQAFEISGKPAAGYAAAHAAYSAGAADRLMLWTARLRGARKEAEIWYRVASLHRKRGELDAARAAYLHELALHETAGDHALAARSLYGLFFVAWSNSRYLEALELARRSFEQAELAGDRERQNETLQGVFTVLYDVGDLAAAQRVLGVAHELASSGRPDLEAELATNEAALLLEQRRPRLARHRSEQALRLTRTEGSKRFLRGAHLNLTRASLELGELERAARELEVAWRHAEEGPRSALWLLRSELELARRRPAEALAAATAALEEEPVADAAWRLWTLRGRAEETLGDPAAAETSYLHAIEVIEQMRRELALDELKTQLLDGKREPYEALVRLRAGRGAAIEAFEIVEQALARTFLDAFIRGTSTGAAGPGSGWWSPAPGERLETLAALLPAMGTSPVVEQRPAAEILAALAERSVLIVFEAGEELWLLAIDQGRLRLERAEVPVAEIAALVDRHLAEPGAEAPGHRLGELLFPPALLPPPGTPLDVVADGAIARLPLAALRRGGRFLIEDHPLAHVPSAGALAAILARPCSEPGQAVVLADPRSDLPAAAREGAAVAALSGARLHSDRAADRAALARAAGARLLHVASHAGLGPRGPWLALADGDLDARRLIEGRIAPRLVVLASCASAVPPSGGPWGSLGGAFLTAGSRAVLAALGSVEDEPTRRLIEGFYREGGAGDPVGALARAQRASIAAGEPAERWAPFVILGSDLSPCSNLNKGE